MANIASNTSSQTNGSNGSNITNLREIYNFLDQPMQSMTLAPGASPYDKIVEMIRGLDLQDDGIMMNHKIKAIESDFCTIVKDENMLSESMNYINSKALDDGEIALKFALLFSSRNFDALAMNETKVRSAMLKLLEMNFLNAETFRECAKDRLYNSITLLGEYYHRVRLANNAPITILGESLIGLLIHEIEGQELIEPKLARLILSQMTLNGDIMRPKHQADITQLLFHIRRNLVEQPQLSSTTKALLLMTLDLYYSSFTNLGSELENFYTKYLVNEEQDEGNNNQHWQVQAQPLVQNQLPEQEKQQDQNTSSSTQQEAECDDADNDSFVVPPTTKKWSEQICEDSMFENELDGLNDNNTTAVNDRLNSNNVDQNSPPNQERDQRHARRPHRPRSPRPLKHIMHDKRGSRDYLGNSPQEQNGEEADHTKPLPRWRATRFNRDQQENQHNENARNRSRRFSGSFDDDHHSVRSEGGSIRLYSINDRLKHSQEKMERSNNNNFSFMVNSNWDRQSQRDDRSEHSYISNYEYGNNQRRGYRGYNNRQNYDKPPRFQKNRKLQHPAPQGNDDKIYSDNWRRTRTNSNNSFNEEFDDSRASTLPRTTKSNYEGSIKSATFRRSQSPNHQREFHNKNQQQRGNQRNYNGRYGSQNSIHSEKTVENESRGQQQQQQQQQQHHHHQQRPNNRGGRRFNMHPRRPTQQPVQGDQQHEWNDTHNTGGGQEENSELVRNARQTTNYMNYLSSKK